MDPIPDTPTPDASARKCLDRARHLYEGMLRGEAVLSPSGMKDMIRNLLKHGNGGVADYRYLSTTPDEVTSEEMERRLDEANHDTYRRWIERAQEVKAAPRTGREAFRSMFDDPSIDSILTIAREAGHETMRRLGPELTVHRKADDTPYTDADLAAHRVVTESLRRRYPSIPVMSGEGTPEEHSAALACRERFVVEPLDGSRTSIAYANGDRRMDGFGVHVALVRGNVPKLGAVFFPARGDGGHLYFTGNDGDAYFQEGTRCPTRINVAPMPFSSPLKAAVSWRVEGRPESIGGRALEHHPEVGGARICAAAKGDVHVAHIDRPFFPWEVAAAHAVLRAAGGELSALDPSSSIDYDHPRMVIPPAIGGHRDTLKLLGIAGREAPTGRGR